LVLRALHSLPLPQHSSRSGVITEHVQSASDYRTGLFQFEPSLWQHNADIDNWRPETGALNRSDIAKKREKYAAETHHPRANSPKCRDNFLKPETARRDATGWLGRQRSRFGKKKIYNFSRLDQYEELRYRQKYRHTSRLGMARIWCPARRHGSQNLLRSLRPLDLHPPERPSCVAPFRHRASENI
jgi:hypothetical protein